MLNRRSAAFAAALLFMTAGLQATPVAFSGTSGSLAASVSFQVIGSDLIVQLTNTSLYDVLVPTEVLTAVFFDVEEDPVFTRSYAQVAPGSLVLFNGAGGFIGGEWAYLSGILGAPGGATQGISSAGLGLFGPGDRFPGSNLSGPDSPDGGQYGITSAGDDPLTGNTPVTGGEGPLIKNSVIFSLGGLPQGFSETAVKNVWFQYGTALSGPSLVGTPEPSSLVFGAIGFTALFLGAFIRRCLAWS